MIFKSVINISINLYRNTHFLLIISLSILFFLEKDSKSRRMFASDGENRVRKGCDDYRL